jgi:type II secretory pathway predicted ATPase ExeA
MDTLAYYSMTFLPFEKGSRTSAYKSRDHAEMLKRLQYLEKSKGLGVFTGISGCGKTYTLREYVSSLNQALYKVVYLQLSTVSTGSFYRAVAAALGLEPAFRKEALFRQIQEEIKSEYTDHRRTVVLIVDEAQFLKSEILRDLVLLLNFDMDSRNYCIFILAGTKSLTGVLKKGIHESLRQRMAVNYEVEGMSLEETRGYVRQALKDANASPDIFSESAIETAHHISAGSVRTLNNLLNKAMIHGANSKQDTIDEETIRIVYEDISL